MIYWNTPSHPLPAPTQNYSGTNQNATLTTQMESGHRRQRRRFGRERFTVDVQWTLTGPEYRQFQTFFRDELYGGTAWFYMLMPDDATGSAVLSRVRFLNGSYRYGYSPVDNWQISATIEKEVDSLYADPEPDLMPLLYQRVQTITADYTLQFTDLNSLIMVEVDVGETVTITLPANAGFSDKFSCAITKTGLGEVVFAGEGGVVAESVNNYLRIFQRFTPVTVAYTGVNRFILMGSLY